MGGVEDRLERIERRLGEIVERLERLEALLSAAGGAGGEAVRLALLFSLPAGETVRAAERVVAAARMLGGRPDPITVAVLEALSDCGLHSVSDVARRVRSIRGTASRSTVRSRLRLLAGAGVVERVGEGVAARYRLRVCGEG